MSSPKITLIYLFMQFYRKFTYLLVVTVFQMISNHFSGLSKETWTSSSLQNSISIKTLRLNCQINTDFVVYPMWCCNFHDFLLLESYTEFLLNALTNFLSNANTIFLKIIEIQFIGKPLQNVMNITDFVLLLLKISLAKPAFKKTTHKYLKPLPARW